MCESRPRCQKPEELQGTPGECSPEQIEKCHGSDKEHPCTTENPER